MKVSVHMVLWGGVVFAVLCVAYATYGLASIDGDMTPAQVSDARGFALFWYFLGAIGAAMAFVSRQILRGRFGGVEE